MWRFAWERNKLWHRVVVAEYGVDHGDWSTMNVRGSYGCGLWKDIWLGRGEFWKQVYFRVGSGVSVWFWKDQWCSVGGAAGSVPADFSSCDRFGCGGGFLFFFFWEGGGAEVGGGMVWDLILRR